MISGEAQEQRLEKSRSEKFGEDLYGVLNLECTLIEKNLGCVGSPMGKVIRTESKEVKCYPATGGNTDNI